MTASRPVRFAAAALLFVAAGCTHTKSTDDGTAKKPEKAPAEEAPAKPRAEKPAHEPAARHERAADETPLSTAPAGLLAPGAEKQIHDRLVADGFLDADAKASAAAMRDGIRRFQRAHDLPATGVADNETVKSLGLDPDQIFRKAAVKD